METSKTPWQQQQADTRHTEKEGNTMVLSHYIKEKDGQNYRHVPVNCPKRLVDLVRKEAKREHGENYVDIPTSKA